jgi:hypothetical protein
MLLTALTLLTLTSTPVHPTYANPDILMVNSRYSLLQQADSGLICYGCAAEPQEIAGSEVIRYEDEPLVEANSGFTVFISTGITDTCPAGKQYVVNLATSTLQQLNVPCDAKKYQWLFSEEEIKYSYQANGKTYSFKFKIIME